MIHRHSKVHCQALREPSRGRWAFRGRPRCRGVLLECRRGQMSSEELRRLCDLLRVRARDEFEVLSGECEVSATVLDVVARHVDR